MSDNRHARDTIFTERNDKLYYEGEDEPIEVPAHFEVCDVCDGRGSHVNPNIDSHGLSAEDFAEDPDFAEDYFAGHYDVTCYACKGKRVILVPDKKQSRKIARLIKEDAEYKREQAVERRYREMGIEY